MEYSSEKDKEALDSVDTVRSSTDTLAEEAVKRAMMMVAQCNRFKKPRLDKIEKYRNLYAGNVPKKYRQPFNANVPVFAGAIDTLAAGFNDELSLEPEEREPADYLAVRKIKSLMRQELTSSDPNAQFPYKTRVDRWNALFSGRGFMMNYGVSDPEYCNHFEVYELDDAIFQPQGGGIMELHLYKGRQNLVRSEAQLKNFSVYNEKWVTELLKRAAKTDFYPQLEGEEFKDDLTKYRAMGLDVKQADYVGERLFRLVEMVMTMNGEHYYLVFSPWYQQAVRFDKLKSVFSADIYPAVSWATHEDNKNFLSKSFADDLYSVADVVHTLVNQELTNRERRNYNARAYDTSMFPDVQKLDLAQTRPDALVPVTVPAGKRIEDGLFSFETAELRGTIDLTNWLNDITGRAVGATDLANGSVRDSSKKATVVFAEEQNLSERMLLRSSPYTEAMGRVGKLFLQSAKDHLPAKMALKRLGIDGEAWDTEIKRVDLDTYGEIDIHVKSSAMEMRRSAMKKEARSKILTEIATIPDEAAQVNPRWRVEEKLRSIAEYDDAEIALAMDVKNYGNKEEAAHAHQAIQEVQAGRKPEPYYGATTLFMQIIVDFASANRQTLKRKYDTLMQYATAHQEIAMQNMSRKAGEDAAMMNRAAMQGTPVTPTAPASAPEQTKNPMDAVRSAAAQMA